MKQTIYKKDSGGKIRFLTIHTEEAELVQTSGVLGTDNPVEHRKICKGKNIGRSNETTPSEQAISEAESKIKEKLRQGYFETIEEAQKEGGADFMAPMLAHDYADYADKIEWPCYVQPKLDGIRCIDTPDGKLSRTNKPILTVDHIKVFADSSDIKGKVVDSFITDGELYIHGLNFQQNSRLIKKYRKGETEKVKYWIYDIFSNKPFTSRSMLAEQIALHSENCVVVPTYLVSDMEEVKKYHTQFLEEGFEGTIIRWGSAGYDVNKRSKYLLKYKDFKDEVYECVDIVPSDARPEQGIAVCITKDGKVFKANFKMSFEEREEMLINKKEYIGQMAEIRFFELSEDGIPRFPVCHGFRIDK